VDAFAGLTIGVNQAIELHDSVLGAIFLADGGATLTFVHAYLHRSEGRPGIDPGTGWSQKAELIIDQATTINLPQSWPCTIADGVLELNGVAHANVIPLPLEGEKARLQLDVIEPDGTFKVLEIKGSNLSWRLIGEAEYLEDFSGSNNSADT